MTRQGDESGDLKPQKTRTGLVILLLANHVQRSAQLGDVYDTPGHQKFRKNNEKTRRYESSASQGIHEGEPRGVSITWPQPATRAIIRPVGSTMSLSASQLWEQDYMVYHASDPERVVRLTMKDSQLSNDE